MNGQPAVGSPKTATFLTVLLLAGIFFLSCVSRFGLGPLMPLIETDLGIGHAQAGSVFLVISLGYCIGMLASSFVSSRLNHRWTVVLSTSLIGGALFLTALGDDVFALDCGMAVVGFAGGLYLPSGISTITLQVKPAHWGKAFALHELAPNLSLILSPLLVEGLLHLFPWRGVLVAFGLGALAGGVIFASTGRGSSVRGSAPTLAAIRAVLSQPSLWILMLMFSMAIAANVGVYVLLPLYLVTDLGLERTWANTLVGFSRIPGVVLVLAAGWLADRWGPRRTLFITLSSAGTMTALLGILPENLLLLAVFLQPVLAACFFPVGFSLLSRLGPLGVSLGVPVAFLLGAGGIPALMGTLADAGRFDLAMLVVGFMIAISALLAGFVSAPAGIDAETKVN
jgi:NNP family nitrate/nitrite transporter-like MFS transporter